MTLRSNCLRGLGIGVALLAIPFFRTAAAPVIDGRLDAGEYTLVASSTQTTLLVDPSNSINDPIDPRAKSIKIDKIYASNDASFFYVFVSLPNYSIEDTIGAWGLLMHVGGVSDALQFSGSVSADPWSPAGGITFDHMNGPSGKNPNFLIKSNFRSHNTASDGVRGYAALLTANASGGRDQNYGNVFNDNSFVAETDPLDSSKIVAYALHGSETDPLRQTQIVYRLNSGIEIKYPVAFWNSFGSTKAPAIGEHLLMQFYDYIREANSQSIRGVNDAAPYDKTANYTDASGTTPAPFVSSLTTYGDYVWHSATSFDVSALSVVDSTHLSVGFSDAAGAGSTTAANFTVTDMYNGNTVMPVASSAVDAGNANLVVLTFASPLPAKHNLRVVVSNLRSTGGNLVNATKNSAVTKVPGASIQVNFVLSDPSGAVVSDGGALQLQGPFDVGQPVQTLAMALVPGKTDEYQSTGTMTFVPGVNLNYKYILGGNYDKINASNRVRIMPETPATQTVNDVVYPGRAGVTVTFTFHDYVCAAAGRDVYIGGDWNGFDVTTNNQNKMTPVPGQPGTYTATVPGLDERSYHYKYVMPAAPFPANYDALNTGDRTLMVNGGLDLTYSVTDTFGTPGAQRAALALRFISGLSEPLASDIAPLDTNADGKLTLIDAVSAMKPCG